MYQYQLVIKDVGGSTVATFVYNTFDDMEFDAAKQIQANQPAGGSVVTQRRLGTWSGSAWSWGAWANWP